MSQMFQSLRSSANWLCFVIMWCLGKLLSNFLMGHMSMMWLLVCCWLQSQNPDVTSPYVCNLASHGPWTVLKQFSGDWVALSVEIRLPNSRLTCKMFIVYWPQELASVFTSAHMCWQEVCGPDRASGCNSEEIS